MPRKNTHWSASPFPQLLPAVLLIFFLPITSLFPRNVLAQGVESHRIAVLPPATSPCSGNTIGSGIEPGTYSLGQIP